MPTCLDVVGLFRYIVQYTDLLPHSQFAPFFSETFRPQLKFRKDVSPPPHKSERRFAPVFIVQVDVSHPNHISERRFAPKPDFRKTFRTHLIIRKDVSPLFIFWKDVSPPNQKDVPPPIVII